MNRERVFGNSVFVSTPYNVTDDQENYKNSSNINKKILFFSY